MLQVLKMKMGEYTPDFGTAIQHFAIHPGGKAVIDTVSKALSLRPEQSEPCCKAFERFGNTSSSSTWCAASRLDTDSTMQSAVRSRWELLCLVADHSFHGMQHSRARSMAVAQACLYVSGTGRAHAHAACPWLTCWSWTASGVWVSVTVPYIGAAPCLHRYTASSEA